jgi:hypothetical protein
MGAPSTAQPDPTKNLLVERHSGFLHQKAPLTLSLYHLTCSGQDIFDGFIFQNDLALAVIPSASHIGMIDSI